MNTVFLLSLLSLFLSAILTFILGFRKRTLPLSTLVPLLAICSSLSYFSHKAVLGYPVNLTWDQMPDQFTVVYFHIDPSEEIDLWVLEGETTRLIHLPKMAPAKEALEKARGQMGQGVPTTFRRKTSERPSEKGENGRSGWKYEIPSYGEPVPEGSLPPKTDSEPQQPQY